MMKKRFNIITAIVFLLFVPIVIGMEVYNERNYKRAVLCAQLENCSDMIYNNLPDSIHLAENIRITILDNDGNVVYDTFEAAESLGNHLKRPEIKKSMKDGEGYCIRHSETTGTDFIYYAKQYDDHIIRASLPYEVDQRRFFSPDWLVLTAILLIFAAIIVILRTLMMSYDRDSNHEKDQETAKLKHEMTSNIAHELKTPVSSVRGYLETIINHPELPEERKQAFIEHSYLQTLRLSDLIRDISLITKIEESPEMFSITGAYLWELTNGIFEEFRNNMEAKHMSAHNELPEELFIAGSSSLIYAIIRNLTENSVRHAGENTEIHIRCLTENEHSATISYYDTGKGVPEDYLAKIFTRFFSIPEPGDNYTVQGSGLGLSIVKNAVAFHGGSITAHPHSPSGIEFRFTLNKHFNGRKEHQNN